MANTPKTSPVLDLSLIPELQLLQQLPPYWKQVLTQAVNTIQSQISMPLNWQSIADECGVSASHFHKKFTQVFSLSPGQYQRRCRIQLALYYLWADPELRVADIAIEVGFSSSQALAKVLRQQLNTSARVIRKMALAQDHQGLSLLTLDLFPINHDPNLKTPATPRFVRRYYPQRRFQMREIKTDSWFQVRKNWQKHAPSPRTNMVISANWNTLEKIAMVGFETQDTNPNANLVAPAGDYLECRVLLNSLSGYYALWDALEHYLHSNKVTIGQQALVLETHQSISPQSLAQTLTLSVFLQGQ